MRVLPDELNEIRARICRSVAPLGVRKRAARVWVISCVRGGRYMVVSFKHVLCRFVRTQIERENPLVPANERLAGRAAGTGMVGHIFVPST